MKITEIKWEDEKQYRDNKGEIWRVQAGRLFKTVFCNSILDSMNFTIDLDYSMEDILKLEFEEIIDWSKVEVDTKVLVSVNGEIWTKRHFAKYENGLIYTFANNGSSWTEDKLASWKYGKLPN